MSEPMLPDAVEQKAAVLVRAMVELYDAYGVPPGEYLQICDRIKELRAAIAAELRERQAL